MNGVIIGYGTIAAGHTIGYQRTPGIDVVAVVDPTPARAAAARSVGLRAYTTFDQMLDHETPDFIDICTPPNTHADYIGLGLHHDLHVLCEKPVLMPHDGHYDHLLDQITAADKVFYPCHNYKFAPILATMQQVVHDPDFGDVLGARFRTLRRGHAVGVGEWNPHWRRDPLIAGGGILRDHGPHSVYLATHLTGRTPLAVSCLTGNMRHDHHTDTEDTAKLIIRCDGDVSIELDVTWAAGYRNSYYSIIGSAGTVTVENNDVQYSLGGNLHHDTLPSNFDDPQHSDWFAAMFADFLVKTQHPEQAAPLLAETLTTSLVIDAAYTSAAAEGRWVELQPCQQLLAGASR
ncbi:Gfo/Idh/MocA family protein [Actinoplanes flavus]|uniref:Gfo/Idh/MocA family oxidoreductase n=1 Tax=Actinoplanes flavus TaxID=2820290 RepID=A0ABS3UCX9_9ACTN|nr:Gfo/Idh/MocA family oxidoreductase [Actinoplanes flavus]MBO3736634.1 Gfo/Idh/MocA family oxidoreductase [Actinoplanes flavus]